MLTNIPALTSRRFFFFFCNFTSTAIGAKCGPQKLRATAITGDPSREDCVLSQDHVAQIFVSSAYDVTEREERMNPAGSYDDTQRYKPCPERVTVSTSERSLILPLNTPACTHVQITNHRRKRENNCVPAIAPLGRPSVGRRDPPRPRARVAVVVPQLV